jgi:hypothetical protein
MESDPWRNVDNIYNVNYDPEEGLRKYTTTKCVFSMWAHFLSFCLSLNPNTVCERGFDPGQTNLPLNIFTGRQRLPVFRTLAADVGNL